MSVSKEYEAYVHEKLQLANQNDSFQNYRLKNLKKNMEILTHKFKVMEMVCAKSSKNDQYILKHK
jgi:hypothetical protein